MNSVQCLLLLIVPAFHACTCTCTSNWLDTLRVLSMKKWRSRRRKKSRLVQKWLNGMLTNSRVLWTIGDELVVNTDHLMRWRSTRRRWEAFEEDKWGSYWLCSDPRPTNVHVFLIEQGQLLISFLKPYEPLRKFVWGLIFLYVFDIVDCLFGFMWYL